MMIVPSINGSALFAAEQVRDESFFLRTHNNDLANLSSGEGIDDGLVFFVN